VVLAHRAGPRRICQQRLNAAGFYIRADIRLRMRVGCGGSRLRSDRKVLVPVTESADLGQLHDLAHCVRVDGSRLWRFLAQGQLRLQTMVVGEVGLEDSLEMAFAEFERGESIGQAISGGHIDEVIRRQPTPPLSGSEAADRRARRTCAAGLRCQRPTLPPRFDPEAAAAESAPMATRQAPGQENMPTD
jgi:hypothetical protein